jgi:hypothetical protein
LTSRLPSEHTVLANTDHVVVVAKQGKPVNSELKKTTVYA